MTTILLADHHSLFRAGMVKLIESIGGFRIVGDVETAEAAIEFATEYTPDILLIEISIPSLFGFEALRRIKRLQVGTRVVALTQCVDQPMPLRALRAGFDGYLGKNVSAEEFAKALYKVIELGLPGEREREMALNALTAKGPLAGLPKPIAEIMPEQFQDDRGR